MEFVQIFYKLHIYVTYFFIFLGCAIISPTLLYATEGGGGRMSLSCNERGKKKEKDFSWSTPVFISAHLSSFKTRTGGLLFKVKQYCLPTWIGGYSYLEQVYQKLGLKEEIKHLKYICLMDVFLFFNIFCVLYFSFNIEIIGGLNDKYLFGS